MKKAILILVVIAALVIGGILYQYKFKNKDITYQVDYYSISVPADWKQKVNDLGAGLDQRLAGYAYGAPNVPVSLGVYVYDNNGLDLKNYLKKKTHSNTYPPSPNRLPDGTISIDYKVIPSTPNHGEGVEEIIYSASRKINGYIYYFGNSKYVYSINVNYGAPNADEINTSAYNQLWQAVQPILDRVINSFTTKY